MKRMPRGTSSFGLATVGTAVARGRANDRRTLRTRPMVQPAATPLPALSGGSASGRSVFSSGGIDDSADEIAGQKLRADIGARERQDADVVKIGDEASARRLGLFDGNLSE